MRKNFENLLGNALAGKASNDLSIQSKIIIKEDFKKLIPPLSDEELAQLEENILQDGIREALIIWKVSEEYILIDGHNRFSISQKHGLSFSVKEIEFSSEDDAKTWMVLNQLGRRNLSPENQSYLRGLQYIQRKAQGKRTDLTSDHFDPKLKSVNTAAQLAKEFNVSEATIKRDAEYARGIDLLANEKSVDRGKLLNGNTDLTKEQIRALGRKGINSSNTGLFDDKRIKSLSKDDLINLAFDFVKIECSSFSQVCEKLSLDKDKVNAKDFFKAWGEQL
jgi:ParB-like chromosome segregation protein Spo0J